MSMILGAQLYTLRNFIQCEGDIAYTLQKVAEMGYTTVQVSGIGKIAPERLKELCDKNGLQVVLTHTPPERILLETEAVIREHAVLGCDYIGIGSMPEKYRDTLFFPRFISDYKEAAKKIAAAGKLLMYHNHNFEFEKASGKCLMDALMEGFTAEELGFTLDTYWVQAAGSDTVEWIEKLRGRLPCVHLKDMGVRGFKQVMAPVMEGNMNFPAILKKLAEQGGTRYLLVEQDDCEESPFVCLKKSYDNLTTFINKGEL